MTLDFSIIMESKFLAGILNRYKDNVEIRKQGASIDGLVFMPSKITNGSIESEGLYFIVAFRTNDMRRLKFFTSGNELVDDPRNTLIEKHYLDSYTRSIEIPGNLRYQYDGTYISDLVYISLEQICFVSAIRLIKTAASTFEYKVEPTYYGYYTDQPGTPTPEKMQFQISRAFISINTPNDGNLNNNRNERTLELNNYRTLKFNPYPEPILITTGNEPALAYELGAPCPPKWNTGKLIWGLESRFIGIDEQYIPMFPRPNPYTMSRWERIRYNSLFPALVVTSAALITALSFIGIQFLSNMKIK
jgi:hypothetical protein